MNIPTLQEFEAMHIGRFNSYYELAIAFTTAHCEAQTHAISELKLQDFNGNQVSIKKESIQKAYPLENIK